MTLGFVSDTLRSAHSLWASEDIYMYMKHYYQPVKYVCTIYIRWYVLVCYDHMRHSSRQLRQSYNQPASQWVSNVFCHKLLFCAVVTYFTFCFFKREKKNQFCCFCYVPLGKSWYLLNNFIHTTKSFSLLFYIYVRICAFRFIWHN